VSLLETINSPADLKRRSDSRKSFLLTYRGWALYTFLGEPEAGLTSLLDAATADREYPDAHAFLAVVFLRSGLIEQADRELDLLDTLDPSPDMLALTAGIRDQIDAALASTTTTAP